jgi:hypothetical protein
MNLIKKLFARSDPPPVPDWMRLPSLSIAVFGESNRTPDLERIRRAYRDLLAKVFPVSAAELAAKRVAIEREYDRLAAEKLEIKDVPARSEMGFEDRASRLLCTYLTGMVWLLMEEGALISEIDAGLIPAVLGEFTRKPRCALIQGRGHHLFINARLLRYVSLPARESIWKGLTTAGLVTERVRYISIDPRHNGRFELD